MAVHVIALELTDLPDGVLAPADATALFVLVRWNNVPVGLAHLLPDSALTREQLRAALLRQINAPADPPRPPVMTALLTIAVCTRDRPSDLKRCLEALAPVVQDGHEVLVVDNASTNESTAAISQRYPVRYVCEPRIGLNNARNRALAEARHELVAYVDDDAVVDRHWADALAEPFSDPEVASATGLVLPLELRTLAQEQFEAYSMQRRVFERRRFTSAAVAPAAAGVVGIGANMALRRTVARELGGFDPRLDAGTPTCSGGDNDMFARILDAGHAIVYTPRALAWHRHRESERELQQCVFGYGVGVFAFLTKRVVERGDLGAVVTGARWLVGPFLRAARLKMSGQKAPPMRLLLLEAGGATQGPFRFIAERRRRVAGDTSA